MGLFLAALTNLVLAAILFQNIRTSEEARKRWAKWDRIFSWIMLVSSLVGAISYAIAWAL